MNFSMLFTVSNLEQLVKNGKQMKKSTFCFFDVNAHQSKKNSCPAIDLMKHLWKLKTRHTFWHTAGYMDLKTVTGTLSLTRFPKLEYIAIQIVLYMPWPKKIQKSLAQSLKWIMSGCHFENFYMRTFLINNSFSDFFSFSEVLWRVPFFRKKSCCTYC